MSYKNLQIRNRPTASALVRHGTSRLSMNVACDEATITETRGLVNRPLHRSGVKGASLPRGRRGVLRRPADLSMLVW